LAVERRVLSRAEHVVFVNHRLRDWVIDRHPKGSVKNAHVIPHSFEDALYPQGAALDNDRKVVFRHIGALYGPRDGHSLLDALVLLRERKLDVFQSVTFGFTGPDLYGVSTSFSSEAARRNLNGTVQVEPVVPYAESLAKMRAADVLVNIDAGSGAAIFLPSKLVDYLGARRPILCLTQPGSPAHELVERGGGIIADVNAPDQIAAAIERVMTDRHEMRVSETARSAYSVQSIVGAWVELFEHARAAGHFIKPTTGTKKREK
jgi:hypothetical protein